MSGVCRFVSLVSVLLLSGCGFVQDWGQFNVDGSDAGPDVDGGPSVDGGLDAGVCGPGSCDGCCMEGVCMVGDSDAVCGARGGSCISCGGTEMCAGGACVPMGRVCPDPMGCPTGCCNGTTCMPGTSPAQCGASGMDCVACSGSDACSAGMCVSTGCSVSNDGSGFVDTCSGGDICDCGTGARLCTDTGTCVSAFGRRYSFGFIRVTLPDRNPMGDCWDGFCGDPDPFVILTVDAAVVNMTSTGLDTFDHTWVPTEVFDATLIPGSDVLLDVEEEDVMSDDDAFACVFDNISAAQLRSRNLDCTDSGGGTLTVSIHGP